MHLKGNFSGFIVCLPGSFLASRSDLGRQVGNKIPGLGLFLGVYGLVAGCFRSSMSWLQGNDGKCPSCSRVQPSLGQLQHYQD